MKRTFLIISLAILCSLAQAQVFNSASTLSKGQIALGIAPAFYNGDFGLVMFNGGLGIKSGVDLDIKAGVGNHATYFGADLEWLITGNKPNISMTTGGHVQHGFAIDLGLNIGFPIRGDTEIYSGLDSDIIFADEIIMQLWVPIGLELAIQRNFSMILEGDIPLNNHTPTIFGGGVIFYLYL